MTDMGTFSFKLEINQFDIEKRSLILRIEKYEEEFEFSRQLWNRINQYLFNFIDCLILVDVLNILWKDKERVVVNEFDTYTQEIEQTTEVDPTDIGVNLKNNRMI